MLYLLFITFLWPGSSASGDVDARFSAVAGDNGPASCILDHDSGLLWERKQRYNREDLYTWDDSSTDIAHCSTPPCTVSARIEYLNRIALCGRRDWRVPRFFELASLVSFRNHKPAVPRRWFDNTANAYYWSATREQGNNNWGIGFTWGFDYAYDRSSPGALRLVAGDPGPAAACSALAQRFVREDSGELLDTRSGIRWAACPEGQQWQSQQCQGQAVAMSFTGLNLVQGRLPTIRELRSLVDPDCPGIGPGAGIAGHLWSSEAQIDASLRQWSLQFPAGQAFTLEHRQQAMVWLIREP